MWRLCQALGRATENRKLLLSFQSRRQALDQVTIVPWEVQMENLKIKRQREAPNVAQPGNHSEARVPGQPQVTSKIDKVLCVSQKYKQVHKGFKAGQQTFSATRQMVKFKVW